MSYRFEDFCCCPNCRADLKEADSLLTCCGCGHEYKIENGIALLMPNYSEDEKGASYHENYEQIAENFLRKNKFESDRVSYRHDRLLRFIGPERINTVLDIGSSHGLYLQQLNAEFKVAFDIALTYLETMDAVPNLMKVQGDAEYLPFKPSFFDMIILADILEHLRDPKSVARGIYEISAENLRLIIHIPWKESLEPYMNDGWSFSHLRAFNEYNFAALWHQFWIVRTKLTYPDMRYPLLFRFERILPWFLYNRLLRHYFFSSDVQEKDAEWRKKKLDALPKHELMLMLLFDPVFKMFELRKYVAPLEESWSHTPFRKFADLLTKLIARMVVR